MTKFANGIQAGALGCLVLALGASAAHATLNPAWWSSSTANGGSLTVNSGDSVTLTTGNLTAVDNLNSAYLTIPSNLGYAVYVGFNIALDTKDSTLTATYYDASGHSTAIGSGNPGAVGGLIVPDTFLQPGSYVEFDLDGTTDSASKIPGFLDITAVSEPSTGPWVAAFLALPVIGSLCLNRWRGKSLAGA